MRKRFESNLEEMAGGRRHLYNVELHNLFSLLNIILTIGTVRWVGMWHAWERRAYKALVQKHEGSSPLTGGPRHR